MLAQKLMYDKFGDDFLIHFVSKGISAAHCPADLAEQYRQKLQVVKLSGSEILSRTSLAPLDHSLLMPFAHMFSPLSVCMY